jgi:DNA-binding response OmpR family regulator
MLSPTTPVPEKSAPPAARRARPHVLLLDDEESILLPTAIYFRRHGCEVDTAREPEEAEALIQHRSYDLAILDLRVGAVGGAAGLEVLREIRRHDEATSVIVLSAYISSEVEAEAWALGADSVLSKPQPLPDLAQLALALIGSKR